MGSQSLGGEGLPDCTDIEMSHAFEQKRTGNELALRRGGCWIRQTCAWCMRHAALAELGGCIGACASDENTAL